MRRRILLGRAPDTTFLAATFLVAVLLVLAGLGIDALLASFLRAEPYPAAPFPDADLEAVRQELRLVLLSGGALLFLFFALWLRRVRAVAEGARRDLLRLLEDLEPSALAVRLRAADSPRELQPLVARLAALAARLAEGLERERRLSSEIARHLRAPVTRLQRLAAAPPGEDPAALDAFFVAAHREALVLERTIADLLALARLEGGLAKVREEDFDLGELLEELAEELPGLAWDWPTGARVRTDRGKLRRVLRHALALGEGGAAGAALCRAYGDLLGVETHFRGTDVLVRLPRDSFNPSSDLQVILRLASHNGSNDSGSNDSRKALPAGKREWMTSQKGDRS